MSELEHIKFEVRPRFEQRTAVNVDVLSKQFKHKVKNSRKFNGKVRRGYVSVFPNDEEIHYWSPHLSVTFEQDEDNPELTHLMGVYGPSPAVWTMFIFIYSIIGLAVVIVTVIGFANLSIKESGMILWALPVLLLIFFSFYFVSYFGQKKGHGQMEEISKFYDQCIAWAEKIQATEQDLESLDKPH